MIHHHFVLKTDEPPFRYDTHSCSPSCPLQFTSSHLSSSGCSTLGTSVQSIPDYVYSQLSNPQVTSPEAKKLQQDICMVSQRGEKHTHTHALEPLSRIATFNWQVNFLCVNGTFHKHFDSGSGAPDSQLCTLSAQKHPFIYWEAKSFAIYELQGFLLIQNLVFFCIVKLLRWSESCRCEKYLERIWVGFFCSTIRLSAGLYKS